MRVSSVIVMKSSGTWRSQRSRNRLPLKWASLRLLSDSLLREEGGAIKTSGAERKYHLDLLKACVLLIGYILVDGLSLLEFRPLQYLRLDELF